MHDIFPGKPALFPRIYLEKRAKLTADMIFFKENAYPRLDWNVNIIIRKFSGHIQAPPKCAVSRVVVLAR